MKTPTLAALAFAATLAAAVPSYAEVETQTRGTAALVPPVTSPQPSATGFVEIRSSDSRQRFEVGVASVDPTQELTVFLDDGTGTMVSAGVLPAGPAQRNLVLDTGEGDALPAGATAVSELQGRALEVRQPDTQVILAGAVPNLGLYDEDRPAYGRSALMREAEEAGPPGPGPHGKKAYGSIRCWARSSGDEIRVHARRLDGAATYELFVENGSGMMIPSGVESSSNPGSVLFAFDTRDDDDLPDGAWSVHDLAGRRVEIRAAGGGAMVLFGRVPPSARRALKPRARSTVEDDDSDGRAVIDARIDYRSGRERLRIDLNRIPGGPGDLELFLDDGTGTLVSVAEAKMKKSGRARFQWDNHKGDALPFEVESLTEIDGRAFEVRVEDVVVLAGNLPEFE